MAVKGDIYEQGLDIHDPFFLHKAHVISSNNYLHDQTRMDKDRMSQQIYFALSLVLAVLTSYFTKYLNWISILIFADILLALLIYFAVDYGDKRDKFWSNRHQKKSTFAKLGLKWRD